MPRDDIVRHLEGYAATFAAPLREGAEVISLDGSPQGGFRLRTTGGVLLADRVVLATGAYQRPRRPAAAQTLPSDVLQIDAEGYDNEAALPPGKVLVIGSGQTGCQIAEELREAGREVVLACGRAPWCSRRRAALRDDACARPPRLGVGDRDVVYWAVETGMFDQTSADLRSPAARLIANIQATGHGGGHDLHYRVLRELGVTLVGHFAGAENGRAHFAPDLGESVAFGDARYNDTREKITNLCAARGIPAPEMPDPSAADPRAPQAIDLGVCGAVIFTSGFPPDYSSWVHLDAFDEMGFPIHEDGASTPSADPRAVRCRSPGYVRSVPRSLSATSHISYFLHQEQHMYTGAIWPRLHSRAHRSDFRRLPGRRMCSPSTFGRWETRHGCACSSC
jgi:putative flavoprotein involved in K+ transport